MFAANTKAVRADTKPVKKALRRKKFVRFKYKLVLQKAAAID